MDFLSQIRIHRPFLNCPSSGLNEILANGPRVDQHIEGVVAAALVLDVLAAEPAKPLLAADIVVGEVAPLLLDDLLCDRERIFSRPGRLEPRECPTQHSLGIASRRVTQGRPIGRQELLAEIVEETPGALWTRALIERQRTAPEAAPTEFAEIVVAVDPPARASAKSDECGLIVAARADNGRLYVLADLTSQGDTPGAWGARVGAAYRGFKANRVVAEINNGGDMVAEVLRQAEPHLPVRAVHATRGKFLRAEPIAASYERGLVFHVGAFGKLEDQLCALTPDFDRRAAGFSPDRADALVWALADLLGLDRRGAGGMIDFWSAKARE
jgi:phage terminase large subunit-like protein